MKRSLLVLLISTLIFQSALSQTVSIDTCISSGSGGGNLVVFANYDGGVLNINVDQNIPNLKIGVCTYEPVTINLSGPFVSNVTEVRYAGYVSTTNFHCSNSPGTTTIVGAPGGAVTSINFLPPSTLANPNGYSSIVCAYSCSTTSNQGGCNTADQIVDYFENTTGGSLYSYYTQYGCWSTSAYNVSAGGNCPFSGTPDTTIVAFTTSASTICAGSTVDFHDFSPSVTGWNWSAPSSNTTTGSSQDFSTLWTTAGSYTVTLSIDDGGNSCSTTQTITVLPQPNVAITATPNPVCEGDSIHLQITGGVVYTWENGSFNPSIYVTPTSSTWFEGGAMGANSCTKSDSVFLVVYPAPVIPNLIYVSGQLQVTPTGFTYQWYLDGNLISGVSGDNYFPTQNGVYSVTYTDANGCTSGFASIIVNDISSAGIENPETLIQIFPNPSNGIFQFSMPNTAEELQIELIDILGKVIYSKNILFKDSFSLDLSDQTKGSYQIKISMGNKVVFGKLILQ